jgi:CARDB.
VSSVASLSLSTGSPLTINAIVPPAIEEMYGTTNITESSINVAPFPNTTVGIFVNITVYAPDAVLNPNVGSNGRNFNVIITNPATHVTTTLTVAEIRNSPYYTGELRVVPAADYSSYAGQTGVISVASGQVNKISVVVDVTTGSAYVNNVQTQFTMTGSSYFYVGSVVAKPTIISSQVVSVSTGQPVTTLTPGQSYEITFAEKNTGNVNATVYAIIEIEVNGTVVTSPEIAINTLSPGQISSIGTVWTPAAAGTYNVTIILYQNPELSIPYVPGTETLTLTVS